MQKFHETPFTITGVFEFDKLVPLEGNRDFLVATSPLPSHLSTVRLSHLHSPRADIVMTSKAIIPAGDIVYEHGRWKKILKLGKQKEDFGLELVLQLKYEPGTYEQVKGYQKYPPMVYLKALEKTLNGIPEFYCDSHKAPTARFVGMNCGYDTDFRLGEIYPADFRKLERLVEATYGRKENVKDPELLFEVKKVIRAQPKTIHLVAG